MDISSVTNDILIPSVGYGFLIGGFVLLIGLGISFCLKLFNS